MNKFFKGFLGAVFLGVLSQNGTCLSLKDLVVPKDASGLLEHKFSAKTVKRVIFKGSGRVIIKAIPPSEEQLSVKLKGVVEDFRVIQAKNGETLVVEQLTNQGTSPAYCEFYLPAHTAVFISGGSIHVSAQGLDGGQLTAQAGVFKGDGCSKLKLFRGSFGKADIDLKNLMGNCEVSCGEGNLSFSYASSVMDAGDKKMAERKASLVTIRQGKGNCTLFVPKECRVFFHKHEGIASEIPYVRGKCHLRFLTYSASEGCTTSIKILP